MLVGNMKLFKAEYHKDERGVLINCMPFDAAIRNVMYLTGRKGDERANHYHKKDTHYWLVVKGRMKYNWEKLDGSEAGSVILEEGDIVLSEVHEMHRFTFLTDGVAVAMATEARTQDSYEEDTIRFKF